MAVDDAIKKILAQSKAKTAPSASYSPLRPTEVSEYEKNFRDYLANQQDARERLLSDRVPSGVADTKSKIAELAQGVGGSAVGYASQGPGFFGDMASMYQDFKPESFANLPAGVQALPTTDDIQDLLREQINPSPEFSAGMTGGNLLAIGQGIAALPAVAKGAYKVAPKIARSLADELLAPRVGASGQQGAIKLPGGNWLPEGTKALQPLRSRGPTESDREWLIRHANQDPTASERGLQAIPQNEAINQFIDKQLTSYVKNDMATPGDPIRALADAWPAQSEAQVAQKAEKIKRLEDKLQNADPRLVPYIQRDIAAVQDEIDAIRSYNPLHFDAPQVSASDALDMKRQEFAAGNDGKWGYGTSRLAQNWEDAADAIINKIPANRYQKQQYNRFDMTDQPGWEWINKVPPDTPLYGVNNPSSVFNASIDSLGFPHLIDELRNATNPASGLPQELLIKPESLSRLSVPQAVERVAKINEWRASQIQKARLENMLKADVHKEYPEEGMRWVQLNKKGQFAEESDAMGHSVRGYEPTENGGSSGYGLGGWDAIQSGKAKVYSLRDAKGQPHATIEVKSNGTLVDEDFGANDLNIVEGRGEFGERGYKTTDDKFFESYADAVDHEKKIATPNLEEIPSITQIKGKSNRAPNDEYLPYVQDFVRSGKWSDVNDLRNTGLINTKKGTLDYHQMPGLSGNASLLAHGRASAAGEIQPYMTQSELEAVLKKHAPEDIWSRPGQPMTEADITGPWEPEGMKRGGPVNQDAMQMAVWDKPVRKAGGSEVTQAQIDAASKPYMMPVPKRRGSFDTSGAKAAGTMLSGIVASIPAGYAGALEFLRTLDPKMAADASEAMQERYMSIPEDQRTIKKVEGLAKYLEPLSVPAQYVGEKVLGLTGFLGLTGSPLAATAAEIVLDPLNYLPVIGKAPAAARAVGRAASKIANAELVGRSGLSGQRGAITYHGTPHLSAKSIVPPHGVRDTEKLLSLTKSMKDSGWQGRPILTYDVGRGEEALTGSHRIEAARQANIDVPIYRIENAGDYVDKNGKSILDVGFMDIDDQVKWLDKFGDKDAAKLLKQEPEDFDIIGREKKGGLVNQDAMQMAVWDKAEKKARGGILGAAELAAKVVKRVGAKKAEELAAIEKNIPLTGMMDKAGLQKAAALSNADKAEARIVTLKDFKALGRDDKVRAIASARAAANKTGVARTTQGLSEAFPEESDMVSSFMASAPYKIRNVVPDEVVDAASAARKSFRSEPSTTPGANASEKEWAAWGKSHGVNMTLTKPQSLGISDLTSGREVMIPGGLSGKFTIPDMFWMKSNNINPASLPQDIHTELMKKFIRTHENKNPDAVDIFNQLDFALLSPSAPLVPNEFLTQRLRIKDMDELRALAGRVGESGLDQSLVNESGVGAALGGGLGIRGTANLKNQAVLADLILRKPEMFQAGPGETLRDVTIRVMNQVPGLGTKTASLGTPWLDLSKANTSAVDLHMIRDATPRLLQDPVVGDAFRSRMANLLGTEPTVEAILAMDPRMVQEAAIKIVGASQSKNYRLASGALNDIPAMAMPDKLLNEPSSFTDFGPFYNRVVDYVDQSRGVNPEIELFPEQWRKWDVIRQRIEPHEFAHPDWRKLPKQSFNEMQESLKEHSRVGYKQSINPAMKTSDWRKMYYGNADPELLIPLAGGAAAASAYLADEAQKQKEGGKVQKKAAGGLTSDDLVLEERKL